MFEKFMEKFSKKEEVKEEMEFKPFEPAERREPGISLYERETAQPEPQARQTGVELKVIRPESYEEVGTVADNLLAGCTVVLNVEVLDRTTVHRVLDFLNGVTYCTEGEIKKVSPSTFIITPHSAVDISDM